MTFVARCGFTAEYSDGERVPIAAGERLVDDHPLVSAHAEMFHRVDDEPRVPRPIQNGRTPTRSALGGDPRRRQMTAEEQGRIRRARLDELVALEYERPEPADAETLFWERVERLLGLDRLKRQAEDDDQFLDR